MHSMSLEDGVRKEQKAVEDDDTRKQNLSRKNGLNLFFEIYYRPELDPRSASPSSFSEHSLHTQ